MELEYQNNTYKCSKFKVCVCVRVRERMRRERERERRKSVLCLPGKLYRIISALLVCGFPSPEHKGALKYSEMYSKSTIFFHEKKKKRAIKEESKNPN